MLTSKFKAYSEHGLVCDGLLRWTFSTTYCSSYLLPELRGDRGTPQLCLRDVDMDLTKIGKLSMSGSPSNSILPWSFTSSSSSTAFTVSKDSSSPFRLTVQLRLSAEAAKSSPSVTQPDSGFGLSWVTESEGGSSVNCSKEGNDVALTCRKSVVRAVGWFLVWLFVFTGSCKLSVCCVLFSGNAEVSFDAAACEAGDSPCRSLKYSESLREELRPCRSSRLLPTSTQGQSKSLSTEDPSWMIAKRERRQNNVKEENKWMQCFTMSMVCSGWR